MKAMIKCPKCGSERITIDGVVQVKKGLMYYLSGANFTAAGQRTGYKMANAFAKNAENAECLACGHKWHEKGKA